MFFGIFFGTMFWVVIIAGLTVLLSSRRKANVESQDVATGKDRLLYFGMIVSLCASIISFLNIIFAAIDKQFVDTLKDGFNYDPYNNDIRLAVSALIVIFPLFLTFAFWITSEIKKDLSKKELSLRKNVFYLIIFVTGVTLVGTLISTIYSWLGGELSARFFAKAGVVLAISLAVFSWSYFALKRLFDNDDMIGRIMAGLVTGLVFVGVIYSVNVLGTPGEMRKVRFDRQRLVDLSNIQLEILNYWRQNAKLPSSLEDINNQFSGYSVPIDPKTGEKYKYKILEDVKTYKVSSNECPEIWINGVYKRPEFCELYKPMKFQLCANFETKRKYNNLQLNDEFESKRVTGFMLHEVMSTGQGGSFSAFGSSYKNDFNNINTLFWDHDIGETCFVRIIDPKIYPPYKNDVIAN